jgi:uncharacterized protein (DUF4415 family)
MNVNKENIPNTSNQFDAHVILSETGEELPEMPDGLFEQIDVNVGGLIVRVSKQIRKESQTDWAKVDAHVITPEEYEEIPELTDEQFAQLKPLNEVLPNLGLGKQRITIMLDEAVIKAYKAKAGKRGYQTLINETLRRGLVADSVKEALREVLKEELPLIR